MTQSETRPARSDAPSRGGFILVAVLWILLALATLSVIAVRYLSESALALTRNNDALQTEAVLSASLELTAYRLSLAKGNERPTHGAFHFRLAKAEVDVKFLSEAARINLNGASKALLAGLFTMLGAAEPAASEYADRVIGWRTQPKAEGRDPEAELYRAAGLRYIPRGASYNHVDELWLVLGLPPALIERALPFVTVYSGMKGVNVLDAPSQVLAALPGMSSGRLSAFLEARDRLSATDPQMVADAIGDVQGATTRGSDAYRVRVGMMLDNGRRKTAEVVIKITFDTSPQPYRILSWQDDIDRDARTGRPLGPEGGL